MTIDASEPQSPGWWFARLLPKLYVQRDECAGLWRVYTGDCDIPASSAKRVRQSYQRLMGMAKLNVAHVLVEAIRQRQVPVGFRTGAEGDDLGDLKAAEIWQANHLDADQAEVHRWCRAMRRAYVLVSPPKAPDGAPRITPEDPREMYAEVDPEDQRTVLAAIKAFDLADDKVERCYLYLPGGEIVRAVRPLRQNRSAKVTGWSWVDEQWNEVDEPLVSRTGIDAVSIEVFTNRSRSDPSAEFEPFESIIHRINFTILERLETATIQAFRQLAVKGLPLKDEQGREIDYSDVFDREPGVIWKMPATAELWESSAVDLGPIRLAIRDDVADFAFCTGLPLYRVSPEAANGSAEGASLQREAFTACVLDHNLLDGESWERVMSHAFAYAGDTERAGIVDLETIWQRPEFYSLAERYDANVKAQAAGVPWRTRMFEILGFTPAAIARMEAEGGGDPPAGAAGPVAIPPNSTATVQTVP